MTSFNDVMNVCSTILAGKPLHIHRRTARVCLHTRWHPCQITVYYKSLESHHLFSEPIFVPVTLSPRYFGVPSYCGLFINENLNIGKHKQINYNTGKIRWVNTQSNHHKNIYTITIIILQSMPPSWGSQQKQSAPSQPTWGTNTHRRVNTITL